MAKRTKRTVKKRSKPDWAPKFLEVLSRSANITAAADQLNISRVNVYQRRNSDPEFAKAMSEALETSCDRLEQEARRRGHNGTARKKFDKGVPLIDPETGEQYIEYEYSDTLLIFLLKAHRPEKYRDNFKLEHSGPDGKPIETNATVTVTERIAQLTAACVAVANRTSTGSAPGDSAGESVDSSDRS